MLELLLEVPRVRSLKLCWQERATGFHANTVDSLSLDLFSEGK